MKQEKLSVETKQNIDTQVIWNFLVESGIAKDNELVLITHVCGYRHDVLNDVLFCRTGYRNMEQYKESELF